MIRDYNTQAEKISSFYDDPKEAPIPSTRISFPKANNVANRKGSRLGTVISRLPDVRRDNDCICVSALGCWRALVNGLSAGRVRFDGKHSTAKALKRNAKKIDACQIQAV